MAVIKDEKGRWGFSVRYKDAFGNTKQKKSVNKNWTKKQAKLEEEKFLAVTNSTAITMNQLREIYIQSCSIRLKNSTIVQKEVVYDRYIKDFFANRKIDMITSKTIEEWQKYLLGFNLKSSSFNVIQGELMAMLNFAFKRSLIKAPIIAEKVINDKPTKEVAKILTKEQFELLCNEALKMKNKTIYNLIQVLYYTGMRIGECLALTNEDIIGNQINVYKTISPRTRKISSTKTNKNRTVIISDRILCIINEQIEYYRKRGLKKEIYIFGGNAPLHYSYVSLEYRAMCNRLNIKPTNIHALRHTHVSNLIALGFNNFEISERTGHSVEMIIRTYGHVINNPQKEMANRLENI